MGHSFVKTGPTFKVRIKPGAGIFQDHHFLTWPRCLVGTNGWQAPDQDMVFEAVKEGNGWDCKADGFGFHKPKGDYGNGSIYVRGLDQVEVLPDDTPVYMQPKPKQPPPPSIYGFV